MAIPAYRWPDGEDDRREAHDPATIRAASDSFEVLADESRLEILAALHDRSSPVSYTDLRAATSIEDNGRFNYHLRRLEGLVDREDGRYALTDRGEAAVGLVLDEAPTGSG